MGKTKTLSETTTRLHAQALLKGLKLEQAERKDEKKV